MPRLQFQFWSPQYNRDMDIMRESAKDHGCGSKTRASLHRRLKELVQFSTEKRGLRDLINACKYLEGGRVYRGHRKVLLSVSIVRRKCNGHEMKHWRVSLKIRRHWLPRAVVKPPSVEIDTLLNNHLWVTLFVPSIPAQVPSNLRHSVIWKFSP